MRNAFKTPRTTPRPLYGPQDKMGPASCTCFTDLFKRLRSPPTITCVCMSASALEARALANWMMLEEPDIPVLPSTLRSRPHTYAAPTPTQIFGTLAADASLVATALQQQQQQQQPPVQRGAGSHEADSGWSVSCCKEGYWGEVLATCSGVSGVVKVTPSRYFPFHEGLKRGVIDYTVVSFASPDHASFARPLSTGRIWILE